MKITAVAGAFGAVVALLIALTTAIRYVLIHRGGLRLLPLDVASSVVRDGSDGAAITLHLSQALNDVALGSTSDMEVDPDLHLDWDTGPPEVTIPGIGVSAASLVHFLQVGSLAETEIHGTVSLQDGKTQIALQVQGPDIGVRTILTEPTGDLERVVLKAAESLYGALRPAAFASYLYRRDAGRSSEVVRKILSDDGHAPARDQAAAYRVWGMLLRDTGDEADAREKLQEAIHLLKHRVRPWQPQRSTAAAYLQLGHTALWQQQWDDAIAAYRRASAFDRTWAPPHDFWGDALQGRGDMARGDLEHAISHYRSALARQGHFTRAWTGWGQVLTRQGRYDEAIRVFTKATVEDLESGRAAALAHDGRGDALFALGRYDEARGQYFDAVQIDPTFMPRGYAEFLGVDLSPSPGDASMNFTEAQRMLCLAALTYRRFDETALQRRDPEGRGRPRGDCPPAAA